MAEPTGLERIVGELKACQRLAAKHYAELDRLNEENSRFANTSQGQRRNRPSKPRSDWRTKAKSLTG
jgi:hypothetical protein